MYDDYSDEDQIDFKPGSLKQSKFIPEELDSQEHEMMNQKYGPQQTQFGMKKESEKKQPQKKTQSNTPAPMKIKQTLPA